jgi:two-component system phosphate regulon sensor histidine kinase PhoR
LSPASTAEIWRTAAWFTLAIAVGLATGQLAWALALAALVWLLRSYRYLHRTLRWMRSAKRSRPPDNATVWDELSQEFNRLSLRSRKRKKKLGKLLSRFRQASAAMPDATVLIGQQGEIDWFNEAAKRMLGLSLQHDVGRRISNLIRDPGFVNYLREGDFSGALEVWSPVDPDMRLSLRMVPFGNKQSLLIARDVTHVVRLEQMRRDFVGNVSHELRTPLTVITGYLEALTDGEHVDPEDSQASLLQMKIQAERMRRIVQDLLMLTRLETGDQGPRQDSAVAIPAIASAIEEDARILSGEQGHRITLEAEAGLWLSGNPEELHSALSNVVSNAVRYTPPGGEIVIRWFADEQGAHFQVQDDGIGIEARHIPRLTERFYRVNTDRSRASGGTGLGLAIVKHVLQRHDARLRVESEPGVGSLFSCDFPSTRIVRKEEHEPAETAPA